MNQDILLTILGGGNLILFIKFLIERHDRKVEREEDKEERKEDKDLSSIKSTLVKLEKDGCRTQLLFLICIKPEEEKEILTLAEHYFKKPPTGLGGNWYMTNMFKNWLDEYKVGKPAWFETE